MVITFLDPAVVSENFHPKTLEKTSPARLAPHGSQARFGWPHNGEEDFIGRGRWRNVQAFKRRERERGEKRKHMCLPWKSKERVFRMIHVKDSLLPRGKVWYLDFLGLHIYRCHVEPTKKHAGSMFNFGVYVKSLIRSIMYSNEML